MSQMTQSSENQTIYRSCADSRKALSTFEVEEKCSFRNDAELLFDWLADQSQHTQKSYWTAWLQFQAFMGAVVENKQIVAYQFPIHKVIKQHIRFFLEHCLREKGNTANTVNRKLAALKSLFRHATSEYYREFNPASNIKTVREDKIDKSQQKQNVKQKIISPDEVKALINHANCYRDRVLFELLYLTGMRLHEALSVSWDDIYNNGNAYYVYILGKGHKQRDNKLPDSLVEKLTELGTDHYLFLSNRNKPLSVEMAHKAIKQAANKAGLTRNISCHTLRHSHASHALANGASLATVRDQLGHSSIRVTSQYLHSNESSSDFISI